MSRWTVILLGFLVSPGLWAEWGIALSSGQGVRSIKPYRIAATWDFGPLWHAQSNWALYGLWESGFAIWDGKPLLTLSHDRPADLNAYSTGPLLRWQSRYALLCPYIELGVGFAWLSETQIQGRMLSLHFQFEDKLGIGLRFGYNKRFDFALRAYHYSNCSIKRPNSGINLAMASLGFWFI